MQKEWSWQTAFFTSHSQSALQLNLDPNIHVAYIRMQQYDKRSCIILLIYSNVPFYLQHTVWFCWLLRHPALHTPKIITSLSVLPHLSTYFIPAPVMSNGIETQPVVWRKKQQDEIHDQNFQRCCYCSIYCILWKRMSHCQHVSSINTEHDICNTLCTVHTQSISNSVLHSVVLQCSVTTVCHTCSMPKKDRAMLKEYLKK